ncbi:MAG TPA: ATP synthase F1 subunit gamma [Bacteroidetes bacterium]|nr:ATP synthase F1 subunit gamma [Bacteroidota bacterium]
MLGLKEIRTRITSITSTQKITSAMKMVSAAKFHKAQETVLRYSVYSHKIFDILLQVAPTVNESDPQLSKWFIEPTELNSIALIVLTSNSSMCGGFNLNLGKKIIEETPALFGKAWSSGVDIFCLGKKGGDYLTKRGLNVLEVNTEIANNPNFANSSNFIESLAKDYLSKKYDAVYVAYNQFKTPALQIPTLKRILPFSIPKNETPKQVEPNLIFEPSKEYIMEVIMPTALKTLFHETLLENAVGEHGARMTAMHQATENANELNKELKLQYNKARQAAITKEILEIVSGAEALKG